MAKGKVHTPQLASELPLKNARSGFVRLRDGLELGVLNNVYHRGMIVNDMMEQGFTVYLCFGESDALDVQVGGSPLPIGRHRGHQKGPFGFTLWRDQPAQYRRRAPPGAWTTAIMVCLSAEYFVQTFGETSRALPPGARQNLALSQWHPSRRILLLAASLFEAEEWRSSITRLRDEIAALSIVDEALATICPPTAKDEISRSDMLVLNKAFDLIEVELGSKLAGKQTAKEIGVSVTTLRRLMLKNVGCTIAAYIQDRRLHVARTIIEDGGSVSSAALRVGYTNPKNFSTAFKRKFGITPRQVRASDYKQMN